MIPDRAAKPGGSGGWVGYLAGYHTRHAGITEQLLSSARDSPYAWLAAAIPPVEPGGVIVDVGCGSAPTQPLVRYAAGGRVRWLGVDVSAAELALAASAGRGPLVRAGADDLPLRDGSADVVCAAMSLQVAGPLDRVLAEIRRVLRPGGTVVVLLPVHRGGPAALPAWGRVFAALRIRTVPWPNPDLVAHPDRTLARHRFAVAADERRTFRLDLTGPGRINLAIDGLYLPDHTGAELAAARRRLHRFAPHGLRLPLPLRRIVAYPAP